MKLSTITLAAAALALAGSAAFADTTVNRTVQVGPNGEVTHVVKRTENPDGSTQTVHRTRRVIHTTTTTPVVVHTTPVVVHRRVVYHSPAYYRHHRHVAYVQPLHRRDRVNYRNHNDHYDVTRHNG
ncbi:MAG: hypothetical protein JWQ76_5472 [Ramlibacter sp.]|nr:hypothetical protein [Ramlibacter sp.]